MGAPIFPSSLCALGRKPFHKLWDLGVSPPALTVSHLGHVAAMLLVDFDGKTFPIVPDLKSRNDVLKVSINEVM